MRLWRPRVLSARLPRPGAARGWRIFPGGAVAGAIRSRRGGGGGRPGPSSDAEITDQIERTNSALDTVSPGTVALFRPPYGARDQKVLAAVRARQMKSVLWNVDSKDWADPIPLSIANRVVRMVDGERRGILLFHDIQQQTVDALPTILETLQARGYKFLTWNGSEFVNNEPNPGSGVAVARAPETPLYRDSFAVVIGIDAYRALAASVVRGE